MPRNGSGVYYLPVGSTAVAGAQIVAATHNTPLLDIVADLNAARPLTAGGTGATSAANARANLGVAPAQTSAEDTTSGVTMLVGAFGLGSVPLYASDFNAIPAGVTGFYRAINGGSTNAPDSSANWALLNVGQNLGNDRRFQIAMRAFGVPDMRIRSGTGADGFSAWAQLLTTNVDVDIDGGTIDGTAIGGTAAAAGRFTTLTATSTLTVTSTTTMTGKLTVNSANGIETTAGGVLSSGNVVSGGYVSAAGALISSAGLIRGDGTNNPLIIAPNSGSAESGGVTIALRPRGSGSTENQVTITSGGTLNAPQLAGLGSGITGVPINSGTTGTLSIASGGTNATTAAGARASLGADDAGNLTQGTIPTARLPSSAGTRDWLFALFAQMVVGAVGALGFLGRNSGTTISKGTSYAGSGLHYSGIWHAGDGAAEIQGDIDRTDNPTGTWMALGRVSAVTASDWATSLFVRVL